MAVKQENVSVKDDEKIVTFVAFCIECYKTMHGISGHEVADLFRKYGVEKYLYEEYEVVRLAETKGRAAKRSQEPARTRRAGARAEKYTEDELAWMQTI